MCFSQAGSSTRCDQVLAWEKRVNDLEYNLSVAVDAEVQTCQRNTKLVVCLADEYTRRLHVTAARASDGLGKQVVDILV